MVLHRTILYHILHYIIYHISYYIISYLIVSYHIIYHIIYIILRQYISVSPVAIIRMSYNNKNIINIT
jgi:hypothetical protein